MKGKISKILGVGLALALVLSFSLVVAVPVAADVSQPTVTVAPTTAGETAAYTIGFKTTASLAIGGKVYIEFPSDTYVPASYVTGDVTIDDGGGAADVSSGDISASGNVVTITLAAAIAASSTVTVVFTTAADIVNPTTAGTTYTLDVWTSAPADSTPVTSVAYKITSAADLKVTVYDSSGAQVTFFTGIDALNLANAGAYYDRKNYTIEVGPGTYKVTDDHGIELTGEGLTLRSTDGAASTIIDFSGSADGYGVSLENANQTIEDLTISRGGSVGGRVAVRLSQIGTDLVGNNFTIKDCTFSDWDALTYDAVIGGNDYGRFTTGATTGGLIEGNTFTGNSKTAIWLETAGGSLDGLVIKDNIFQGCLAAGGKGIMLVGDIGDTIATKIEGNTISDMTSNGIVFWTESDTDNTGKAIVTDNSISGCSKGIYTKAGWVLTITGNTIEENDADGIWIGDGTQGTKTIEHNNISGNASNGLNNQDVNDTIDAENNWWGSVDGPADSDGTAECWVDLTGPTFTCYNAAEILNNVAENTATLGNSVTDDNVDYCPWLLAPYTEEPEETILDYYRGADDVISTSELLTAITDWAAGTIPSGFTEALNTTQLLALITEWAS